MRRSFPGPSRTTKKQRKRSPAPRPLISSRQHASTPGTILILGGTGHAGTLLAEYLLRETPVKLVIAGRNHAKAELAAERLRRAFPGRAIAGRAADAANAASLRSAFSGIRMVLVASTTTEHAHTVGTAALECGADYLDIQYSRKKNAALRALEPEILKQNRCFITEAGFHPGLPAALVRYAAASLERFDKARLASVVNMKAQGPMPSSMVELVEGFQDYDSQVFHHGHWQKDERSGWLGYRKIDFGEPFGVRRCAPMMWGELRALPGSIPSLKELGSYVAGFHPVIDTAVIPVMMTSLALFKHRAHSSMAKLLFWSLKIFPSKPLGTALVLDAEGEDTG
ncbi:MAG: saccharopine dehydrogenase NADP-binding domain-containing protein, partial [Proteobacteria bacterium]|nr:saccharopine dehydrogenase NADP-binding domain-containing protein [Pseudomonadota bacterium]